MADDQPQRSRSRPPPRSPAPAPHLHQRSHSITQHSQPHLQQQTYQHDQQQYQQQQPARVSHLPVALQRHMLGPPLDPYPSSTDPSASASGPQLPPLTLPQSAPMDVPIGPSSYYPSAAGPGEPGGYGRVASSLPVQWAPQDAIQRQLGGSAQRRYPNPMWDDSAQRAAGWRTAPTATEDVEMRDNIEIEARGQRRRSYGPSRAASPGSHVEMLPQAVLPPLRDPSSLYPSYGSTSLPPPTRVHTASPQIRAPRPSVPLQPPPAVDVGLDVNMRGRSWDTIMIDESSTAPGMIRGVASTASQGSASDDETEEAASVGMGDIPPAVAAATSTGPGGSSSEAGPSTSSTGGGSGGKKAQSGLRRAEKACNYCRDRKLRCTPLGDGREGCRTCEVYGKECVYVGVVKRRGPGVRKDKGTGTASSSAGGEEGVTEELSPTGKKPRKSRAGAVSATRGGSRRRGGAATSLPPGPPQPLPSPVPSTESGGAEVPPASSTASSPRHEQAGFFTFPPAVDRARELSTPVQGGAFEQDSTRMAWSASPSAHAQRQQVQQAQYGDVQGAGYRDPRAMYATASEELNVPMPVSRSESRSPNTFLTGPVLASSSRMVDPRLSTSARIHPDDVVLSGAHDPFGYPGGEHVEGSSSSYSSIPPSRYQQPHQHRQIPQQQHPTSPSSSSSPTGLPRST